MSGVAEVSSKYLTEIASNPTPLGYEQTEVGMIPKDWEIFSLPEVIWYQEGPGLRKWQFKSKGLKVINVTNLQESGYLDLDRTDRHISWDEFEKTYKHFACDEGDLVIASSGNSYCKASIVRSCDLPLLMNTSVIRFKPIGEFSKGYMEVYLKSPYFKDQIDLLITGGAQPNFGPAHLNLIKIPAPTCAKEQIAIANALSDVDALISELEKLIAKKQAIKTATMQQLLTGRTRLPQFALREDGTPKRTKPSELGEIPEDWEVKTYGEVFTFLSTSTNSRADLSEDGDFGYVHYGDIHTEWNNKLDLNKERLPRISKNIVSSAFVMDGDLIMADASEDYEGIGKTVEVFNVGDKQLVAGLHTFLLRDKEKVLADGFRGYLHSIPAVKSSFDRLATGMKVYGISKNNLSSVCIPVPSLEEQTAIATILSDMDEEIQALEQRLGKTRQIKQGMMQELLTGKTRLMQPLNKESQHG
ncbi:restriction endonuclease subunit S [Vibrio vulnificus]|nr:restriction endonuclease subunit S [Vibrio vulnificus]